MERMTHQGVERGFPWALCAAIAASLLTASLLGFAAPHYADSQTLVYLEKLRRASEGPPVDVMVLGASQSVAAVQPAVLEASLPPGTRVYNYAAPAMAPSGGEVLLRLYLAGHEPPNLLVLSFAPMMYGDRRGEFERFTLKDALGLREVLLAVWADTRPAYLLSWLSTRLPTVRYREGLSSGALAAILDGFPAFAPTLRDWLGTPDDSVDRYRFDWRHSRRAIRNEALRQELEQSGGWHFWKESATGGRQRRGAPGWASAVAPDPVEPFRLSSRERAALERMLALCSEHGVRVLIPTVPHARWFAEALRSGAGGTRLDAFWAELRAKPGVTVGAEPTSTYPPRRFSDSMHLDPKGAARFSAELAREVARLYAQSG